MKVQNFIFAPILLFILGIIAVIIGAVLTITLFFAAIGIPVLIIGIIMMVGSIFLAANLVFTSIRAVFELIINKIRGLFLGNKSGTKTGKNQIEKDDAFASKSKIIDVEEEEKGVFKVK
jgi:hypothetical protein